MQNEEDTAQEPLPAVEEPVGELPKVSYASIVCTYSMTFAWESLQALHFPALRFFYNFFFWHYIHYNLVEVDTALPCSPFLLSFFWHDIHYNLVEVESASHGKKMNCKMKKLRQRL